MKTVFVTICVGESYLHYFKKILLTYDKSNFSYPLYIYTDLVEKANDIFKNYSNIKIKNFNEVCLDKFNITSDNYRANDSLKLYAFCDILKNDKTSDFIIFVDCDMMCFSLKEKDFFKNNSKPGFYYELIEKYKSEDEIIFHMKGRIDRIRDLGFDLKFLSLDDFKFIFPVERFWGLKRSFNFEEENKFIENYDKLFSEQFKHYENDLYSLSVEMSHLFASSFNNIKSYKFDSITFCETNIWNDLKKDKLYNHILST